MSQQRPARLRDVVTAADKVRLVIGLAAIFLFFQWLGIRFGSDRGQAGLIVGGLVVAATLAAERLLFDTRIAAACTGLGLGKPRLRGIVVAAAVAILLLATLVVFTSVTGTSMDMVPGWIRHYWDSSRRQESAKRSCFAAISPAIYGRRVPSGEPPDCR